MIKCPRTHGFLRYPLAIALTGLGVLAVVAVQWPLALAVFCDAGSAASAAPAQAADADAQQNAVPEKIQWRYELDAALDEAAKQGKPVLVDFTAEWCPPCQLMEQEVWPDKRVRQRLHENYIPVKLDVDRPENAPAARRYGVRAIPTILVLNAEGEVQQAGNFMPLAAMVRFLDRASGRN